MTTTDIPQDDKLRELILYVAENSQGDPDFGATKLNKILFYSDFWSYGDTGKAITGQRYRALEFGPVPVRLLEVRDRMIADGDANLIKDVHHVLKPLRAARVDGFTDHQLKIVDRVIRILWGKTPNEVSELSHTFIGWRLAAEGEEIPYGSVFLSGRKPTEEEVQLGRDLERQLDP